MGDVVIPPERDISDIVSSDILDFSSGNNRLNAVGGDAGIRKLADAFCQCMETQPELAVIRARYPDDLTDFRETLATFLLTWIRGEVPLYTKSNGRRYLNTNRRRVRLNSAEKDAWLRCMQQALDTQPLSEVFKRYIMVQLTLSAEMTRKA